MANAKERVKDFPSVVGTIQSDDYIPVDGATQGTRKATVDNIMEATISGLETTATNMKAALNEVATTAGKVWVGTQDEYDDLPDTKLTDNVLHCITDGSPTQYEAVWDKVGTSQLQTQASNCSDAINELDGDIDTINSNLTTLTTEVSKKLDIEVITLNNITFSSARQVEHVTYTGTYANVPRIFLAVNTASGTRNNVPFVTCANVSKTGCDIVLYSLDGGTPSSAQPIIYVFVVKV